MSECVYRVLWRPGTDELIGQCHCGAEHITEDPIEMWEWLLAHPEGHDAIAAPVDVRAVGSTA